MSPRIDTGSAVAGCRFPVRADTDGDFDLDELTAMTGLDLAPSGKGCEAVRLAAVEAAATARLWDLSEPAAAGSNEGAAAVAACFDAMRSQAAGARSQRGEGQRLRPATSTDLRVLHCFETTSALRPPVAANTAALTPTFASAWLALALHWIGVAAESDDLRFLNGACKLLGAVAIHPAAGPGLRQQLITTAHLLKAATAGLQTDLANRLLLITQFAPQLGSAGRDADAAPHPEPLTAWRGSGRRGRRSRHRPRIAVLAGAGSSSPPRLVEMTAAAGVRLTAVCWYGPPSADRAATPPSGYDQAWYPLEQPSNGQHAPGPQHEAGRQQASSTIPQTHANDWDQVADTLNRHAADLVILAGMPIVPAAVLSQARLGVINAHNGALPTYRGMDAVAWALLNNDPIICTLHRADPGVDTGSIYTSAAVPFAPSGTLRARVKHTQMEMLTAAAVHVAASGSLPAATAQPPGLGRQFYRLHPHLKRVLDTSPLAGPAGPEPTSPPASGDRPEGALP